MEYQDWVARGLAATKLKQYGKAVRCYDRALACKPGAPRVLLLKASVLHAMASYVSSTGIYDQVLELYPNCSEAWFGKGCNYTMLQEPDPAIEAYKMAIRIKPNYYQAYINYARQLALAGNHGLALSAYEKALEIIGGIDGGHVQARQVASIIDTLKTELVMAQPSVAADFVSSQLLAKTINGLVFNKAVAGFTRNQLLEMFYAGDTLSAIALLKGVSRQRMSQIAKELGIDYQKILRERRMYIAAQVRELTRQGLSRDEIKSRTPYSRHTIDEVIRKDQKTVTE